MSRPASIAPPDSTPADPLGRAFALHGDHLRRVAHRGLDADLAAKVGASDIVQDTFFAASRDLEDYRGGTAGEFRRWLESILRHRLAFVRRHFRGSARRRVGREVPIGRPPAGATSWYDGEIAAATTASPLSRVVRDERAEALRAALAGLSERDRAVILWHGQDRLTFEAIGARLDMTADAARKRWARAIIRLRAAMGPDDDPR